MQNLYPFHAHCNIGTPQLLRLPLQVNLLDSNKRIHLESPLARRALLRAPYQSYCFLLLPRDAFKRPSVLRGKNKVVFDFGSSEATFGIWKMACLYKKDKKRRGENRGRGENRARARLKWVGVVRYWFAITAEVDPDAARGVHLCYQRWTILIVVYYDQEYFFLKTTKLESNKRLLSGA